MLITGFIGGSKSFATNLRYPTNDLNINLFNCKPMSNSVFCGVGNSTLNKKQTSIPADMEENSFKGLHS